MKGIKALLETPNGRILATCVLRSAHHINYILHPSATGWAIHHYETGRIIMDLPGAGLPEAKTRAPYYCKSLSEAPKGPVLNHGPVPRASPAIRSWRKPAPARITVVRHDGSHDTVTAVLIPRGDLVFAAHEYKALWWLHEAATGVRVAPQSFGSIHSARVAATRCYHSLAGKRPDGPVLNPQYIY